MTGLKPRTFVWVIADRLAVSERIGGYGFHHRRVRREEEITWLRDAGITAVVSLLEGNQNLANYEEAGFQVYHEPLVGELDGRDAERVFNTLREALADPGQRVLIHRDLLDDTLAGLLGGYLIWSGMLHDPIVAAAVIEEILGRPLGPEGKRWIPSPTS